MNIELNQDVAGLEASMAVSEAPARSARHKTYDKPQAALMTLASKLKYHRILVDAGNAILGLTQSQAGEKSGVNRNTISLLEQGKCEPLAGDLDALAKAYGLNDDDRAALFLAAGFVVPEVGPLPFTELESDETPKECPECKTMSESHFSYCPLVQLESDDTPLVYQGEQPRGFDPDSLRGETRESHVKSEGDRPFPAATRADIQAIEKAYTSPGYAKMFPQEGEFAAAAFTLACTCVDRKPGDLHAAECPIAEHLRQLDLQGLLPLQAPADWFDQEAMKDALGIQESAGLVVSTIEETVVDELDGVVSAAAALKLSALLGKAARVKGDVLSVYHADEYGNRGVRIFRVKA